VGLFKVVPEVIRTSDNSILFDALQNPTKKNYTEADKSWSVVKTGIVQKPVGYRIVE